MYNEPFPHLLILHKVQAKICSIFSSFWRLLIRKKEKSFPASYAQPSVSTFLLHFTQMAGWCGIVVGKRKSESKDLEPFISQLSSELWLRNMERLKYGELTSVDFEYICYKCNGCMFIKMYELMWLFILPWSKTWHTCINIYFFLCAQISVVLICFPVS